ncbi:Protein spinster 3, partial [Perkinsus olseni]
PKAHLVFFTSCYILIFFDRGLIAGLNLHLKETLSLTNFEAGVIGGMFILGYVIASPLFAILGQVSRVWTIRSICIGLVVRTSQYAFLGEALAMIVFIVLAIVWQNRFK